MCRSTKDVQIPANFTSVGDYSKSQMGKGRYAESGGKITGDDRDVDRITKHVLGDGSTPGNPRDCSYESVAPVVRHSLTGTY